LIKDQVTIEEPGENILSFLNDSGHSYQRKEDVNAMSLKAFFRDILGMKKNSVARIQLSEAPKEFNVFIKKSTYIK
jgi:hypothetical protein